MSINILSNILDTFKSNLINQIRQNKYLVSIFDNDDTFIKKTVNGFDRLLNVNNTPLELFNKYQKKPINKNIHLIPPSTSYIPNSIIKMYNDFKKLQHIQSFVIPTLFFNICSFNTDKNIPSEILENFKEFRKSIFSNLEQLKEKVIKVKDIRNIYIEKISVINYQKVITVKYEITLHIIGKNKLTNELCKKEKNYTGIIRLSKIDREWLPINFSFNKV